MIKIGYCISCGAQIEAGYTVGNFKICLKCWKLDDIVDKQCLFMDAITLTIGEKNRIQKCPGWKKCLIRKALSKDYTNESNEYSDAYLAHWEVHVKYCDEVYHENR